MTTIKTPSRSLTIRNPLYCAHCALGSMQAEPNGATPDLKSPQPPTSPNTGLTKTTDCPMQGSVMIDNAVSSGTSQPVVSRLQRRKRTAQSQAENEEGGETGLQAPSLIPPKTQITTPSQPAQAPNRNRKNRSNTTAGAPSNADGTGSAGIEN